MMFSDLLGRRVLIIEDDFLQASNLTSVLEAQGSDIVGPYADLAGGAIALENANIDAAVLDVRLGTEFVFSLADSLLERNIPFLFVTGYDRSMIPPRFSSVPHLQKPVNFDEMTVALAVALAKGVTTH